MKLPVRELTVLQALCFVSVFCELYSSLAGLDRLIDTQKVIINIIEKRISVAEDKLSRMRRLKNDYEEVLRLSSRDFPKFISNPINAFVLIKKLTSDWASSRDVLSTCERIEFEEEWKDVKFPDANDLSGAVQALLRLQQTYDLQVTSIADGKLNEAVAEFTFTSGDCFEVGRQALFSGYYDYAILWLELAKKKVSEEQVRYIPGTMNAGEISRYMKLANFEKARSSAWMWAQSFLKIGEMFISPDSSSEEEIEDSSIEMRQMKKKRNLYNIHTDPVDLANYNKLCQISREAPQMVHVSQRLRCKFVVNNPYLLLRPAREERLWLRPKISMYHNVVSDGDIEIMKSLALPILERAEVAEYSGKINHRVSESRVTKIAWLRRSDHPVVSKIYRHIEDVTGLSTNTAEAFQMANYGLGGHFHLHLDVLPDSDVYFGPDTGNRIATWLIYLSDVETGGATAFPRLNFTVWPKKGSALFWHNIKSDSVGDFLTLHGACPVVTGSKWVSNVWLHERGQEFRLRCGKSPDSPLVHL